MIKHKRDIQPVEDVLMATFLDRDSAAFKMLTEEERLIEELKVELEQAAFAENTWAGYKSDIQSFIDYAGIDQPFPVSTLLVENYLAIKSLTLAPSTLKHHAAALSFIHVFLNYEDPTDAARVKRILAGYQKKRANPKDGTKAWEPKQAPAFTVGQVKKLITSIDNDTRGLRDRTLLLVGLVCAFRQNELSKLQIEDLKKYDEGYHYKVHSSKTDQDGTKKRYKVIPYGKGKMCPVKAIDELMVEIGDDTGPLFRGISRCGTFMLSKNKDGSTSTKGMSHTSVNAVLRKRINLSGIIDEADSDKHEAKLRTYSFHSLRSTFITILRACGVPDSRIMKQTHHTNINIIEMYDRAEMHFKDSAAGDLIEVLIE